MRSTPISILVFLFAALSASTALAAKPICGDGKARGSEDCDGADLSGTTCQSLGFDGGTLACDAGCAFDTSGCTSAPVVACGDGVLGGHEECDGGSDAACPGLCSNDCACPAVGPGGLEVHFIDVGQGDAILIVSPEGFAMLVDSGEEFHAATILDYMSAAGITSLDYTLVSHMHADHIGAMDLILNAFPEVVRSFDSGATFATSEYDEYDAAAGARRETVTASRILDLGPSIQVEVLHAYTGSANENDNSVVVVVRHGGLTFLFGGDCEEACESELDPGHVDVYKVHHHGSDTSSTTPFLARIDPYTGVIGVGAGNAYGHPTASALSRLAAQQTAVYRTDLEGDVVVLSDGATYTVNGDPVCLATQQRACGVSDVGICQLGAQDCIAGMWGSCQGATFPTPEDCSNGLDDNCDGLTDGADPQCASGAASLVISQVAYDTPGTDSLEEFVDLYNPTAAAVSLDGWSLTDNASTWSFPSGLSLASGAYFSVARDAAGFRTLHGLDPDAAGMTLGLGNSGDFVSLADAAGEVDRVAWEGYEPGWDVGAGTSDSIERLDPTADSNTAIDWSVTAPAAPRGGTTPNNACGNAVCDADEDCSSCPQDCPGVTNGKPSSRYCCGNGVCEAVGEDAGTCPIDCF